VRKRLLGLVAATAFAITVVGTPAAADAQNNGDNCVGFEASDSAPPGFGLEVKEHNATYGPGAMAARIVEVMVNHGCWT